MILNGVALAGGAGVTADEGGVAVFGVTGADGVADVLPSGGAVGAVNAASSPSY